MTTKITIDIRENEFEIQAVNEDHVLSEYVAWVVEDLKENFGKQYLENGIVKALEYCGDKYKGIDNPHIKTYFSRGEPKKYFASFVINE